jgi:predicted Rossmann fold nucleotide-binding protein DprA/Smf involved in DNA uptake
MPCRLRCGRILYLSPFAKQPKRVTKDSAIRRNQVVAALADDAYVAHAAAGSQTARIAKRLKHWEVPFMAGD